MLFLDLRLFCCVLIYISGKLVLLVLIVFKHINYILFKRIVSDEPSYQKLRKLLLQLLEKILQY